MTKEEMKTLIAEKISGQGNQVDIGGALAEVLNGIMELNEPVIAELEMTSGGSYQHIDGTASFDDVKSAVINCKPAYVKIHDMGMGYESVYPVLGTFIENGGKEYITIGLGGDDSYVEFFSFNASWEQSQ